jgi:hypothetical protein
MRRCRRARAAGTLLVTALLAAAGSRAELAAPFVVTDARDVALMMRVADVGPEDYLIDLGSGDGRIVIAAAERGALAHGVEIDPALVLRAGARARAAGVADRVAFVEGDLFEADLSGATVLTLYLFPEAMLRLRPKVLETLAPGTRVLSNSFDFGEWKPDAHLESASSGGLLVWIVPARVAGQWELRLDGRVLPLALEQRFQEIAGTLAVDVGPAALEDAVLEGTRIRFTVADGDGRWQFSGTVDGASMGGFVQRHDGDLAKPLPWTARRVDGEAVGP